MSRTLPLLFSGALIAGGAPSPALAEAPRVAVDIAPVHSLVARVMQGVGEPALVIPPGASPHEHSLRPSEATSLQEADIVFWVGADLTPWMAGAVETLAEGATVTALLDAGGTTRLDFRDSALFEAHAHGADDHGDHDDHGDEAGAEDHDHHGDEASAEDDHHDHGGHGAHDPHAWLSPDNAAAWMDVIAAELSDADPGNAGAYAENAATAIAEIEALKAEIDATLEPVRDIRFIVFHDAYQYFERAFEIPASGAISLGDAADPSPARIAGIQARMREESIDCVLAEPQFNPGLVTTVLDGTEASIGVLDPLGSDLDPGPALYPQLLRNLADTLAACR